MRDESASASGVPRRRLRVAHDYMRLDRTVSTSASNVNGLRNTTASSGRRPSATSVSRSCQVRKTTRASGMVRLRTAASSGHLFRAIRHRRARGRCPPRETGRPRRPWLRPRPRRSGTPRDQARGAPGGGCAARHPPPARPFFGHRRAVHARPIAPGWREATAGRNFLVTPSGYAVDIERQPTGGGRRGAASGRAHVSQIEMRSLPVVRVPRAHDARPPHVRADTWRRSERSARRARRGPGHRSRARPVPRASRGSASRLDASGRATPSD